VNIDIAAKSTSKVKTENNSLDLRFRSTLSVSVIGLGSAFHGFSDLAWKIFVHMHVKPRIGVGQSGDSDIL